MQCCISWNGSLLCNSQPQHSLSFPFKGTEIALWYWRDDKGCDEEQLPPGAGAGLVAGSGGWAWSRLARLGCMLLVTVWGHCGGRGLTRTAHCSHVCVRCWPGLHNTPHMLLCTSGGRSSHTYCQDRDNLTPVKFSKTSMCELHVERCTCTCIQHTHCWSIWPQSLCQ